MKAIPAALLAISLSTAAHAQMLPPDPPAPPDSVFAGYPAEIYRGKPRLPDFKGEDRQYWSFRTRLRNGAKGGVNFGGKYALIEIGCGAGCRSASMVDVSTGRVKPGLPLGGEDNMYLSLRYKPASRLVLARWVTDQRCMAEKVEWTGTAWREFDKEDLGPEKRCWFQED